MPYTLSIWEEETHFSNKDVVIVGAGLAGLWCAREIKIKYPSASVLVVERGMIPCGASTRNAGFACFGSPTELIADEICMGEEDMWKVVEMRYKGIEKTRKVFGDKVINYEPSGGYECLEPAQAQRVNDRLGWLNVGMKQITGKDDCFSWSNGKLPLLGLQGFDSLIENEMEGGLHSGKLMQALQQMVVAMGVSILYNFEVTQTIETGQGHQIISSNLKEINTTCVLYCTNAFTHTTGRSELVRPARGQVLVTAPINNLRLQGTFHYDEGFYYFRNLGGRVLLGGARNHALEEENTNVQNITTTIQYELERFLSEHVLNNIPYQVTHRWSGIMGFTKSKKPLIEAIGNNAWAVIACNGMGVALTPIIAEAVAELF